MSWGMAKIEFVINLFLKDGLEPLFQAKSIRFMYQMNNFSHSIIATLQIISLM